MIAKSLYRASALGFVLIMSFLPFVFIRDQTYAYHNAIVPMERLTYNAMMFRILADMQLLVFILFYCYCPRLAFTGHCVRNNPNRNSQVPLDNT